MLYTFVGLASIFASVAFLLALLSLCCVIVSFNDLKVVECGHELAILLPSLSFWKVVVYIQ